jgi:hypothetical protein
MTTENTEEPTIGAFSISQAFHILYEAAKGNLSKRELEFLAGADEYMTTQSINLAALSNGLAALIGADRRSSPFPAGAFNEDTDLLLWLFGDIYDISGGVITLRSNAQFRLDNFDELKAEESRLKRNPST